MQEISNPRTASEWLIALRECPDDDVLIERFNVWLAASDENVREWDELLHLRDLLDARGAARAELESPMPQPVLRGRKGLVWGAAAAALCLLVFVGQGLFPGLTADYAAPGSELRRIGLEDGSEIVLAPGAAIDVAFSGARREVTLLAGRAFFEVAPDKQRPFTVRSEGMEAVVVGTAFEIRGDGGRNSVAVQHGVVRAGRDAVSETLRAGDMLAFSADGKALRSKRMPERIALWRNHRLLAAQDRFSDVVEEIDAFLPGLVIVTDERLGRQTVTGAFRLDDPEAALDALSLSHGARIRRFSPWITLISGE
ncbi:FecR domain-containing protein [Nisaea acidiphila]|uniref:FecR domain-containing protein n=1 Tax=Nisaea acidiphila TaxID=1862145 RepID=A0A9J7AVB3_9PROT|nr:FecR domain-containing protein [Nisaea acidiphila]UUX51054.1 FecR domain-containing protein [Nisaea acidiphila]